METLPLETVQRIFELACTDGGSTGFSLSLVSRDFSAIARKIRFHSVALAASPRRLQAFVELYERECESARGEKPRIRHLHVTFPCIVQIGGSIEYERYVRSRSLSPPPLGSPWHTPAIIEDVSVENTASSSTEQPLSIPRLQPSVPGPNVPVMLRSHRRPPPESPDTSHPHPTTTPEYLQLAQTLFRLSSPDLLTLVVQGGFTRRGDLALSAIHAPFPRLREAAFVGISDIRALLSMQLVDGPTKTPLFPALTHLSLASSGAWRREPALSFWFAAAPRVTHLSVADAHNWVGVLASAVGLSTRRESYYAFPSGSRRIRPPSPIRPPPVPAYPSVRHLFMQPGPGPIGARCGNAWMGYNARVRTLRQIEQGCGVLGIEAVILPAPKDLHFLPDQYASVRSGWLERIEDDSDNAGCWGQLAVENGPNQ
ncbi:hypothetical protein BC628DRAFT_1490038 [Trametes gibbosa]|nr:hypothetical protein BC628DRAFT_1490038 [Trametes gibbosa]